MYVHVQNELLRLLEPLLNSKFWQLNMICFHSGEQKPFMLINSQLSPENCLSCPYPFLISTTKLKIVILDWKQKPARVSIRYENPQSLLTKNWHKNVY
jgi:hypothetical protein